LLAQTLKNFNKANENPKIRLWGNGAKNKQLTRSHTCQNKHVPMKRTQTMLRTVKHQMSSINIKENYMLSFSLQHPKSKTTINFTPLKQPTNQKPNT
jgi:hypothetical protein